VSANQHNDSSSTSPNWTAVLIYYGIACGVSWPFFWWKDIHPESWANTAVPPLIRWMCLMWGPGIAALVSFALLRGKHPRTITFWGNSKIRSACFYLLPMLLLAFTRPPAARISFAIVRNPQDFVGAASPLMFGLFTIVAFLFVLGEELGWRGFLQDALRPVRFFPRFVCVGVLWEFWHFTNRTAHGSAKAVAITLAISYPAVIIVSFIIGMAVERSRSLCVAVTLHSWGNLLFNIRGTKTFVVFGFSVLIWIYLLWRWPQTAERPSPERLGRPD
jgi:membrane protease YdiL (CAAX protease family)